MIESDTPWPATGQLTLELKADQAGMSGTIHQPGQPARPFSGWLELLSVLETWRTSQAAFGARPEAMASAESASDRIA